MAKTTANFFYTDTNGKKRGPISREQLQRLATQGLITPETPLETDTGHKGVARQIEWLFSETALPEPEPESDSTISGMKDRLQNMSTEVKLWVALGASWLFMLTGMLRWWIALPTAILILAFVFKIRARATEEKLKCRSSQDDAQAQYDLAYRYLRSRLSTKQMTAITVQDLYYRIVYDWSTMMPDEAIELLTQAAEKGHVDAQYELGNCYAMGTGVEQNAGKAVHWFEKAAAQKHTDAQWKLADLLREEQVRQTTQQRKESFSSIFGKALMSGSGVGNRSAFTTFFVHLLLAGLCAGFLCFFAPAQIRKDGTMTLHLPWGPSHTSILPDTERRANFASWCGIVGACGLIFVAVLAIRCIVGTKITVYENGITGTGVGKNFDYQVDFSLYNFQLEYDKITSVDATGTAVTIHASGMQYKCYADNPSEIQRVIVTQLHKHKK